MDSEKINIINDILEILKNRNDSRECYVQILELCCDFFGFYGAILYRINYSQSIFEPIESYNVDSEKIIPYPIHTYKINEEEYIIRNHSKLGIGWIKFFRKREVDLLSEKVLLIICEILSREFEKRWITLLFTELITPVDLRLPENEYYYKLNELACKSANMKYSVMRKYDQNNDQMRALAIYKVNDNLRQFNLNSLLIDNTHYLFRKYYDVMKDTSQTNIKVFNTDNNKVVSRVNQVKVLKNIKTVVVAPLIVGGEPVGTLSFGVDHFYELNHIQLKGFANISNSVGAALSYYMQSLFDLREAGEGLDIGESSMRESVTQGLRHTIRNSLHAASGNLKIVDSLIKKRDYEGLIKNRDICVRNISVALKAVKDQKEVGKKTELKFKKNDIYKIFNEAVRLVQYQLMNENIIVNIQGNEEVYAETDKITVRNAFINLLLNSIEAFSGIKKRGRKISFKVEEKSEKLEIYYSDNGCGFKPNHEKEIYDFEDLWKIGKTTKKDGSGYGLPYVRTVFQKFHIGSAYIMDGSNGMKFKIIINKNLN